MDEQPQLVDEPLLEQRPHERGASRHADVLAGLRLERSDRLAEVALEQGRVLPVDPVERHRDDDLRRLVHGRRHGVHGCVLVWPEGRPFLVGAATEEEGVAVRDRLADYCSHLVVEVGEVPVLRRLDDAVERDEERCGELSHWSLRRPVVLLSPVLPALTAKLIAEGRIGVRRPDGATRGCHPSHVASGALT
jgi:hypothetical protein